MQFLMLYVGEDQKFDRSRFERALAELKGVSEVKTEGVVACAIESEYAAADDSVIVRLAEDEETVSIHGTGVAAQQFTLEFRKEYGEDLHLIDTDYSFDLVLDGTQTAAEVQSVLESSA